MSLLDAAMEKYYRERGTIEGIPLYILDYHDQPRLREFFASHQSSVTQDPHVVRVTVAHDDEDETKPPHEVTCEFVVSSLEPVWVPDEDSVDEVRYRETPDWRGEGYEISYDPATASYRIVNRVKFLLESNSSDDRGLVTDGNFQFLDHQPG